MIPLGNSQKDTSLSSIELLSNKLSTPKHVTERSNRNSPHVGSILPAMNSLTQVPNLVDDTI